MSRWFRFYDEALDDPKVQRLAPNLFRAWVNLLCITSKNGGVLPCVEDITFKLRMSENDAKSAIEDLIIAGLIDISANGEMRPHSWNERQFASDMSKDRTRKWREKKGKTGGDVTVTASDEKCDGIEADTEAETYTETESKHTREEKFENRFLGKGSRALSGRLKKRAEGLGLDVDALERRALAPDVKIPNAFFRKLVVDEIRQKHPIISETLIKAALSKDNDAAYGTLCQMMLEFA